MTQKWADVEEALKTADSIAFDGCHKIYVLMDDQQTREMEACGYGTDDPDWLTRVSTTSEIGTITPTVALKRLHDWFDSSCGLRFISSVRTVEGDPNSGFTHLISQFDDYESEDEDDDDD